VLIIMCGPPGCGKSKVVDLLLTEVDADCVRPSDWMPENIETLGPQLERDYRIQCWKTGIEKAQELVKDLPDSEIIILDCANAKYHTADPTIRLANKLGHKTVLLYVNAKSFKCRDRMGENWIGDDIFANYIEDIKTSLPKYRKSCRSLLVIDNNSDTEMLVKKVEVIRGKLCLST